MEAKHTKEYAEKLANKEYESIKNASSLSIYNSITSNQRNAYIKGYLKAIKETSAPDLLEFITRMVNENNFIDNSDRNEAIELINKQKHD